MSSVFELQDPFPARVRTDVVIAFACSGEKWRTHLSTDELGVCW